MLHIVHIKSLHFYACHAEGHWESSNARQVERNANIKFYPVSLNFSQALEKPENGGGWEKSSKSERTDSISPAIDPEQRPVLEEESFGLKMRLKFFRSWPP